MKDQFDKKKFNTNEIDFFEYKSSGYAFIKREHTDDSDSTFDVFNVYGSDGTLLAAFENEDTALAAIIQSGLEPTSLHWI